MSSGRHGAVMGLYLANVVFWLAGYFDPALRRAALWCLLVFMGGLLPVVS